MGQKLVAALNQTSLTLETKKVPFFKRLFGGYVKGVLSDGMVKTPVFMTKEDFASLKATTYKNHLVGMGGSNSLKTVVVSNTPAHLRSYGKEISGKFSITLSSAKPIAEETQ